VFWIKALLNLLRTSSNCEWEAQVSERFIERALSSLRMFYSRATLRALFTSFST
jgi:hypothetical protein